MTIDPPPWRRQPVFLAASLALVAVADRLFHEAGLGLNAALLCAALAGLAWWRHPRLHRDRQGRVLLALAGLAAGLLLLDAGVIACALAIAALACLAALGRSGSPQRPAPLLLRAGIGLLGDLVAQPFQDGALAGRWRRAGHATRRRSGLGAWLLPLLLGSGFVVLFAIANPVVAGWLDGLWRWVLDLPSFPSPLRIVGWWLAGAGAWLLLRGRWRAAGSSPRSSGIPDHADLAVRSLLVFNLVFLGQNLLDLRYLWLGAALPDGMGFASYAHRGAYTLVATALLAACFILAWFRPGSRAESHPWARRLAFLWMAQNGVLLLASAWRLWLYVDMYGLSRWRVAAAAWLALVAAGLVLVAWRLWRRHANAWLLDANALAAAAALAVCAAFDVDGAIAWHNTRHSRELGAKAVPCDVAYLAGLGPASLPALRWFAAHAPPGEAAAAARDQAARLEGELRADLADWRAWTLRRRLWAAGPIAAAPPGL